MTLIGAQKSQALNLVFHSVVQQYVWFDYKLHNINHSQGQIATLLVI